MLGALLKGFSDFGMVRRAFFFRSAVPKVVPDFVDKLFHFVTHGRKRKSPSEESGSEGDIGNALDTLSSNLTVLFPYLKKGEH